MHKPSLSRKKEELLRPNWDSTHSAVGTRMVEPPVLADIACPPR